MSDRRRINGPSGGTKPPVFRSDQCPETPLHYTNNENNVSETARKIFLTTGLTPSASGSAYLELVNPSKVAGSSLLNQESCLKITCTVHGPRPLPKSSTYSPHMQVSTTVKFAPFGTRFRRGYLRDSNERDIAAHLETAIRGVILTERWPKSGIEIVINILEGDSHDSYARNGSEISNTSETLTMMSTLAGCITATSAAIIDAGIDCIDIVAGGTAGFVKRSGGASSTETDKLNLDLQQCNQIDTLAACVVGYLPSRDELTEIWLSKGTLGTSLNQSYVTSLIDGGIKSAKASALIIRDTFQSR